MTTCNDTVIAAYALPSRLSLARLARALGRRLDGWLERRASRPALASLDSHTLADIGIDRGDFPSIASGTYRHPRDL